jgi:hypothetical protein
MNIALPQKKPLAGPSPSFVDALHCAGPAADRADEMGLYGWLIGSWEMDSVHYRDDGTVEKSDGECHFGWVLEGRAIQDVWIRPKRPAPSTMYGTTLRIFDPEIGAWHIIWSDPSNQDYGRQIGRPEGEDIVQLGHDSRGLKTRWRFTEITADSFHWIGEERSSESEPWKITYEHFARRIPLAAASSGFVDALHCAGPAADRADKMGLYGWLIGAWEMEVLAHDEAGATHKSTGEVHFGWALEGRAVQDVWITPPRSKRAGAAEQPVTSNFYGTTLRIYDPDQDAWHIFWFDPVKQFYTSQRGRPEGEDILQLTVGETPARRWRFTEITPNSFHWIADVATPDSPPDRPNWRRQVEFFARRVAA